MENLKGLEKYLLENDCKIGVEHTSTKIDTLDDIAETETAINTNGNLDYYYDEEEVYPDKTTEFSTNYSEAIYIVLQKNNNTGVWEDIYRTSEVYNLKDFLITEIKKGKKSKAHVNKLYNDNCR